MAAELSIVGDGFTTQATYGDKLILVHQQLVRICTCYPFVLDCHMRNYRRVVHMLLPHHRVPTAGIFNQSWGAQR